MASGTPQFVVAAVQRNSPEPGRELAFRLILFSAGKDAGEHILRQILSAMHVANHPGAEVANWFFPVAHQLRKSGGIVP